MTQVPLSEKRKKGWKLRLQELNVEVAHEDNKAIEMEAPYSGEQDDHAQQPQALQEEEETPR